MNKKTEVFYNRNKKTDKYSDAFTIVELLVVIVVIGILAAITLISFTGVSQKASVASAQTDFSNTSKQIKLFTSTNDNYPASINDCPLPSANNVCAKVSPGTNNVYHVNNSSNPKAMYLLTSTTNIGNARVVEEGGNNLLLNADFEIDTNSNEIPDSWSGGVVYAGGTGTAKIDKTSFVIGNNSYAFNKTNSVGQLFTRQSTAVIPGNTYTFSCWVKSDALGTIIDVGHDSSWSNIYLGGSKLNQWTRLSMTYVNTTTVSNEFRVGIYGGTGTAYFDGCRLINGVNPF